MLARISLARCAFSGLTNSTNPIEDRDSAITVFGPDSVSQEPKRQVQGRKYSTLPGS